MSKRSKIKGIYKVLAGTLFVLVLALVVVLVVMNSESRPTAGDMKKARESYKYAEGVSVQGIPLGGMSYNDAKTKVAEAETKLKDSLSIPLTLDTFGFLFKAGEDFDVKLKTEAALDDALLFGNRGGSKDKEREEAKTKGRDFPIAYDIDTTKIAEKVKGFAAKVNRPATDATVTPIKSPGANDTTAPTASPDASAGPLPTERFKYTDGQTGIKVKEAELTQTLTAKLTAGDFSPAIIPAEVVQPTVTTEQLKKNTQLVAKAKTLFQGSGLDRPNRMFNIAKAADLINAQVIQPGEEWSINNVLGNRSDPKNGWKEAPGYENGITTDQLGGGVCQVSTTLFLATLRADIATETMTRQKHTFRSHYVDPGQDATISSGSPDFKFVNSKSTPVYIFTKVDKTAKFIEVYIYGEPLPVGETIVIKTDIIKTTSPNPPVAYQKNSKLPAGTQPFKVRDKNDGIVCSTYREYYVNGKLDHRVKIFSDSYKAYPELWQHSPDVTPPDPDIIGEDPATTGAN